VNWFWTNIPLEAIFFGAWVAIPMWLCIKHPDTGPAAVTAAAPATPALISESIEELSGELVGV
jgi:hypothetical protein